MIIVPAESGPAPMPKIYRSGPVVPEEAPAKKKSRLFRTYRGAPWQFWGIFVQ